MIAGLKKAWGYILAALILGLSVVLAAYFRARGNKRAAAQARADATETLIRPRIRQAQAELATLNGDASVNTEKIAQAEQDLAQQKEKLHAKFKQHGLSAEETAARFRSLRL